MKFLFDAKAVADTWLASFLEVHRALGRAIFPAFRASLGWLAAMLLVLPPVGLVLVAPLRAEDGPRTAILCAYEPEWQALLPSITDQHAEKHAGVTFVTGRIEEVPVVLIESGVSTVNAALAAQAAIDHHTIDRIIVVGISGGVSPDLHIGDVVIPDRWSEYLESVFAREQGGKYTLPSYFAAPQTEHFGMIFPQPARIPRPSGAPELRTWFQADAHLLDAARKISAQLTLAPCTATQKCLSPAPRLIIGGSGVSGPAFVDNAAFRRFAHRTFQADAVDMEAAAVAQVAYMNKVPFLAIRSLSDLAGADADGNQMEVFQELASENAVTVLKSLLVQLREAR
jgi:adenosylhomocysteine nucleosidase